MGVLVIGGGSVGAGEVGGGGIDLAGAVDGAGDVGLPDGEPGGVPGGVGSRSDARGTEKAESMDTLMVSCWELPRPVSCSSWMLCGWRKASLRILACSRMIFSISG